MKKSLMMKKIFIYMIDFLCQIKILLLNKKNMFEISGYIVIFVQNFMFFSDFVQNSRFFQVFCQLRKFY